MNFIEELKWRGMLHDVMPGTEEALNKGITRGYIGFDPTADSLGVGNMVQIMTLLHFQNCGHKPIALIGGATGMVGDPSGKSQERNLLDEETLRHNQSCQQKQLEKFLDFNCGAHSAEIVNNYDWFKEFGFLSFIRDIGKHISVNYMLAKDSVKSRLESGMSFTEFTYQLVQGYDFYYLWKHQGVMLQMGGSDQWGNIVTGTELIRRKDGGEAFALTTPLIKKADGTKFGKSEGGNIWLDPARTSPYKFYQFWLNASDEDVKNYIRIFTLKTRDEIEVLELEHGKDPGQRILQKALAVDITSRVHSKSDLESAQKASEILFGKSTSDDLKQMDERSLLEIFEGVPKGSISISELNNGLGIMDALVKSGFLSSNGEAKRALQENSISVNKQKAGADTKLVSGDLLNNGYILLQKGKKSYFLLQVDKNQTTITDTLY
jgi:tyrosyl-tRNA synthetase